MGMAETFAKGYFQNGPTAFISVQVLTILSNEFRAMSIA